jgi:peptidoglycan hydrolase-like protein with peptidoglycan-binding domain
MATREESIRRLQEVLHSKGHNPGAIDGDLGPKTVAALRSFQQTNGLTTSGKLDERTMEKLGRDPLILRGLAAEVSA